MVGNVAESVKLNAALKKTFYAVSSAIKLL